MEADRIDVNPSSKHWMRKGQRWLAMDGTAVLLAIAIALIAAGCQVGYGFRGPGYDPEHGITHVDATDTVWLAVTTGEISFGKGKSFFVELNQVMEAMPTHEGLVGYAVKKQLIGPRVWTMSVWIDIDALHRFIGSSSHRQAVRRGGIPADTVRSVVVEIPASRVPISWKEAKRLLTESKTEKSKDL